MLDKPTHPQPGQLVNLINPEYQHNPYFKHRRYQSYYGWDDREDFKTWFSETPWEISCRWPRCIEYKTPQFELLGVVVEVFPFRVDREMEIQTQDEDGDPVDKVAVTFQEHELVKIMLPCSGLKWVYSESVYPVAAL